MSVAPPPPPLPPPTVLPPCQAPPPHLRLAPPLSLPCLTVSPSASAPDIACFVPSVFGRLVANTLLLSLGLNCTVHVVMKAGVPPGHFEGLMQEDYRRYPFVFIAQAFFFPSPGVRPIPRPGA